MHCYSITNICNLVVYNVCDGERHYSVKYCPEAEEVKMINLIPASIGRGPCQGEHCQEQRDLPECIKNAVAAYKK